MPSPFGQPEGGLETCASQHSGKAETIAQRGCLAHTPSAGHRATQSVTRSNATKRLLPPPCNRRRLLASSHDASSPDAYRLVLSHPGKLSSGPRLGEPRIVAATRDALLPMPPHVPVSAACTTVTGGRKPLENRRSDPGESQAASLPCKGYGACADRERAEWRCR